MLALARYMGCELEGYETAQYPVQVAIFRCLAFMADRRPESLVWGIDGCGAPTLALELKEVALMAARMAHLPEFFKSDLRRACAQVSRVMHAHPEMVGGSQGQL